MADLANEEDATGNNDNDRNGGGESSSFCCKIPASVAKKPISVVNVLDNEESNIVHPFLRSTNNWMDQMLIWQLIVDQPFAAAFGKSGQAWKTCAERLSQEAQDPDGNLVYAPHGVSNKGIEKDLTI